MKAGGHRRNSPRDESRGPGRLSSQVQITWNPKAEGRRSAGPATVQVREEVTIEEGVMRTRLSLAYEISRADLKELSVQIRPIKTWSTSLTPNVQKWRRRSKGRSDHHDLPLPAGPRATERTLEIEKFSDERRWPRDGAEGNSRSGCQSAECRPASKAWSSPAWELAPGRSDHAKTACCKLMPPISPRTAGQDWPFAYRYAAHPYTLTLSVEKFAAD